MALSRQPFSVFSVPSWVSFLFLVFWFFACLLLGGFSIFVVLTGFFHKDVLWTIVAVVIVLLFSLSFGRWDHHRLPFFERSSSLGRGIFFFSIVMILISICVIVWLNLNSQAFSVY